MILVGFTRFKVFRHSLVLIPKYHFFFTVFKGNKTNSFFYVKIHFTKPFVRIYVKCSKKELLPVKNDFFEK